jgi:hypothetical protein
VADYILFAFVLLIHLVGLGAIVLAMWRGIHWCLERMH